MSGAFTMHSASEVPTRARKRDHLVCASAATELDAEPLSPAAEKKVAAMEKRCVSFHTSNGYSEDEAKEQCAKDAGDWIQKKICVTEMQKEGGHTTAEIKATCKDEADSAREASGLACRKAQRAIGVTKPDAIRAACSKYMNSGAKAEAEPAASSSP